MMGNYFCEGRQHHRESRDHGFNIVGNEELGALQLCDECYSDHLERVEETKAADRSAYENDRRKRND